MITRCWACNSEVQVPSEVQEPRELGSKRLQKLPEASRRLQNLHKLPEASKTCRRCKRPHKAQQPSEAGRALVLALSYTHVHCCLAGGLLLRSWVCCSFSSSGSIRLGGVILRRAVCSSPKMTWLHQPSIVMVWHLICFLVHCQF